MNNLKDKIAPTQTGEDVDVDGGWSVNWNETIAPIGTECQGWDVESKGPVPCLVNFCLRDILAVDTVGQTFRPRVIIVLDWVDDGIITKDESGDEFAFKSEFLNEDGTPNPAKIWRPSVEFVNSLSGWIVFRCAFPVVQFPLTFWSSPSQASSRWPQDTTQIFARVVHLCTKRVILLLFCPRKWISGNFLLIRKIWRW
jgi:hypothetical protein